MLNSDFVTLMQHELGGDQAAQLVDALCHTERDTTIRLNLHKLPTPSSPSEAMAHLAGEQVEWCSWARRLAERPSFTLDAHFQSGRYYVQEASSMFVGHLLMAAYGGELPEGIRVLDMCAAPGGKSTLYGTLVGRKGTVVANEVIRPRALTLSDNVMRWGLGNTVVTSNDPSHFASSLAEWFDVVAVDAPCSGEGMMRKSDQAREEWSLQNVELCAARQRRIMADAWAALRPGGLFIYSTCTFNRAENEENMEWLSEQYECQRVEVTAVPEDWGIVRTEAAEAECFRFFPHLTRGEGLFVAVVRKADGGATQTPQPRKASRAKQQRKNPFAEVERKQLRNIEGLLGGGEWVYKLIGSQIYAYPAELWDDQRTVCEQMSVLRSGICVGEMFKDKLRPDHSLALAADLVRERFSCAEIGADDAIRYLRREEIGNIGALDEGINLLLTEGSAIGFTKRVGGRTNSLLPKELRILQQAIQQ